MGNYEQLKQAVSNVIKDNGNYEITGDILQNTLLSIISTVGGNATFAGIATPETNPGTPDQNVFYLASEPGVYTNFGGVNLIDQVLIFANTNGQWVAKNTNIPLLKAVTEARKTADEAKTMAESNARQIGELQHTVEGNTQNIEVLQNVENYDLLVSGHTEVSPNADSVNINIQNLNVNGPSTDVETINIPAATPTTAGAMSAADKTRLDLLKEQLIDNGKAETLPADILSETNIVYEETKVTLEFEQYHCGSSGGYQPETKERTISAATETSAGVMSAEDKTLLTKIENIMLPYYGIEFDTTISTPTCTRIGDSDLHKSLPIQSRMRGCLLDDNGKVVEYLNPTSWLQHDRTGARGQVMVEIPSHYERFITDGTKRRVMLSEYPIPGFQFIPTMYVSAYEAALQRSTSKLCSVVNDSADYRGGNNTSAWDGTYRSLLGRPATSINRTNFRQYARNRNSAATAEWNCYTYLVHKTITWLFVVEYATLNSQADYNAELTAEGFRQGGLGAGVSTFPNWITYNSQCPFVPCGFTDSIGNGTGVMDYTALDENGDVYSVQSVPRYRGIENPFGHIWKWTDGCNFEINPTEANGGNGLTKAYICNDPALYQDTNYDGYQFIGNMPRINTWIIEVIFGVGGEILPKLVGGGSTTYFCDFHYTYIPKSGEALHGLLFGGPAHNEVAVGLACSSSGNVPSRTAPFIGSRLCFIPEAA